MGQTPDHNWSPDLLLPINMEKTRIDTEAEGPPLLHLNCFQALHICTNSDFMSFSQLVLAIQNIDSSSIIYLNGVDGMKQHTSVEGLSAWGTQNLPGMSES